MTNTALAQLVASLKKLVNDATAAVLGTFAAGYLIVGTLPADTDTQVVAGVTLTYKTTPAAATHVQIAATAAEQAANIASVLIVNTGDVQATVRGAVVKLRAVERGTDGNAIALANSTGSKITRSAATLTGGTDPL